MDAINERGDGTTPRTHAAHGAGATASTNAAGTGVVPTSCLHRPACGGAAAASSGGAHASASDQLRTVLGRLQAAVDELQRVVAAFAQRIAGGGSTSPLQSPLQRSSALDSSAPIGNVPIQRSGALPTNATSRTSVIPALRPGASEQLSIARGQVTYRQVPVTGGSGGTVIDPPVTSDGVSVELYALRDYAKGAHRTQVLEPVSPPLTVPEGQTVTLITRIKGTSPGAQSVEVAGARMQVQVGTATIDAMPMMAWINESNASSRGVSGAAIGSVLAHFGVAATGNSGQPIVSSSNRSPVQYFSAAYEAAHRVSPAETARRIVEAERRAGAANPNATFWVQVSDEQDTDASQAQVTTQWIRELRSHLAAYGSQAKLFVAAQARPHNLVYASVIDGWATTQSAAGRDRATAIRDIQAAAARTGRSIELMEYPGNQFFDAGTPGSAAISTASAALDGASSWFIYSANNLDVLERGGGDEGRGDIGGLVAIDGGRVLPTLALIEAELGANLGAAARAVGASGSAGARQLAATSAQIDAYRHTSSVLDLRAWEAEIGRLIR